MEVSHLKESDLRPRRSYGSEIEQLASHYAAALAFDVAELRDALARVASGPAVFVGTGGTFSVAVLAARLHEQLSGQPARVATPLEFCALPPVVDWGVVLFSAGLRHPDALAVADRMGTGHFRTRLVVTLRPAETVHSDVPVDVDVVSLPPLTHKEGFLATSSVVSMAVTVSRAYEGNEALPPALPWPDVPRPNLGDRLLVLRPPDLAWVAIDIEVRCHELGLAAVQVTDYRNFAHGRHVGLARHAETTSVIGLVSTSVEPLALATLKVLPPDLIDAVAWHPKHTGTAGALELLVASIQLAGGAADAQSVNAARPGAPDFGRRLYHLNVKRLLPPVSDGPVARKLRSIGAPLHDPVEAEVEQAYTTWLSACRALPIRGLVLDYDGTMCPTQHRFEPPPSDVQAELIRLLDAGLVVGIASGRGKSLHAGLRSWVPSRHWDRVFVGLYNGGLRADLGDEVADSSRPSALMADVVERLDQLPIRSQLIVEPRTSQVTIAPSAGTFLRRSRVRAAVDDALRRDPPVEVKLLESAHSIDIVPRSSSKRAVLDRVAAACDGPVMAIGDQGDLEGNDYELLASVVASLTVDSCSPDVTRCWYLGRGGTGSSLLKEYLAALRASDDAFVFHWGDR